MTRIFRRATHWIQGVFLFCFVFFKKKKQAIKTLKFGFFKKPQYHMPDNFFTPNIKSYACNFKILSQLWEYCANLMSTSNAEADYRRVAITPIFQVT